MSSQNERIEKYLKSGKSLTPMQALRKFNCWALSSRISNLHKKGLPIKSELISVGSKTVARYWI